MDPALRPGDVVLARKAKTPKSGDIVIALHDNREIIKRINEASARKYYLLGDNQIASTDSRKFGWVDSSDIRYVVFGVIRLSELKKCRIWL